MDAWLACVTASQLQHHIACKQCKSSLDEHILELNDDEYERAFPTNQSWGRSRGLSRATTLILVAPYSLGTLSQHPGRFASGRATSFAMAAAQILIASCNLGPLSQDPG